MTPFRWFLMVVVAVLGGMALLAASRPDGVPTVKIAAPLNRDHPTAASLLLFKERLEALSNQTMRVEVFFDSSLGSAEQTLELSRIGDVEMVLISTAVLIPYVPEANAVAMPFIWSDSQHQFRAMDGQVGEILRQRARSKNIEILGYLDAGTRNITTRRGPIEKPEDLRGMSIRVMGSPLMVATIDALGASANALNMGEVYSALQMGVIDGWENNPTTIAAYRMWETGCRYFAWTHHFSLPDLLVAGEPFYSRLTEEQRAWVQQAATETIAHQRRLWQESEEHSLDRMREAGMIINEVDVHAFRQTVRPLYERYYERYGSDFEQLCELILSMADEN